MTKQEKIKESYGEDYDKIKYYVDVDGWLDGRPCDNELSRVYNNIFHDCDRKFDSIRPKSLKGIENNNGWIKIESEDDLPKLTIEYYVLKNGSLTTAYYRGNNRWVIPENDFPKTTEIHKITHYQPIEKPKPPLY